MLHSAFENFAQVRRALQKFFAQEQPGDSQYALIALGRDIHVVIDSTRDPATILAAIDSKDLLKTIQDTEAANISMETTQFSQLVSKWCNACNCTNRTQDVAMPMCPALKGQIQSNLFSSSERRSILDSNFLEQLTQLVAAMSSMPTRRTVLFISDGFNRFPGRELYSIVSKVSNDPSFRFDPRDLQPQINEVLKLAVRYDIRFYTLDLRGLYTPLDGSGNPLDMPVAHENGDAMSESARETGGTFFENSNDLFKGISRAFADGREEYVLAYVPANTKSHAGFRRISVELKNKKLHVLAKTGYWAH